ncbi:uncharacterized protein BDZ99DRAFT_494456 [Mytilinidion resinicola]|uniref:Uncharacterized protein n=1 Tax=Mytilinidion resinicola TaxID=574789 RepID=A0A6A6Z8X9_9PEZI|nr:uncharacterized protein BDZ99DRAFT_494456 [Mytilinidion resinicola]KAF2816667.1 hypothetical protein BDZ99DRAFT_494456 [Mytilinidion resinicola]
MEASQHDREKQWAYELDQQIRALSTMCSLVMDKFPNDSSKPPAHTNPKHREAVALSVLLIREPGENVTVAAAVDALSSRPYHELVVATNMDQDAGSSNYKYLFAPDEITDCEVLPDSDSPPDGFDRHVKVFGTLLRAYHNHFQQPTKRARFKRAFLTYSLGAGLPEYVHRLSFGVEQSSFVSFILSDLPHFGEDFEPLTFLAKDQPKISSMGMTLVDAVIRVVQQALHRKEDVEVDDAYELRLRQAMASLKKGEFDHDCAYALHIILRIRLRWVFKDIERALSSVSNHEAPESRTPDPLHWTTTLLQWDHMVTGLKDLLDMYGTCIDTLKNGATLMDENTPKKGTTLANENAPKDGDAPKDKTTPKNEDHSSTSTVSFNHSTHPHLTTLFRTPRLTPLTRLPYGTALTAWLRHTTSQPRAARTLLHPRCAALAALASHLTILPLSATPPADPKMDRHKAAFSLVFPGSVLPRGLHGWPATLKSHLSGDTAFQDLWQRRFPGSVPQEAQVLMALARVGRVRPPSRAMPVVASARLPAVGAAVVADRVVEAVWGRPWEGVRKAEPGRRVEGGKNGKKMKVGQRSGCGCSGEVAPFCVPEGLAGTVVEGIRDVVVQEVRARIGEREVRGLGEGLSEEVRELNERKRTRGQGSLMRHRERRGEEGKAKRKEKWEQKKDYYNNRKRAKREEGEKNRAEWERYQAEQKEALQAGEGAIVEQEADKKSEDVKVKPEADE